MLSNTTYTESDLVLLLQQQQSSAFEYLYDNYSGALYAAILEIINDRETANDVLQDVFVKIWKQVNTYDKSKGKLFTWMINIARNASIDVLRSKQFKNSRQNLELKENVHDMALTGTNTDMIGLNRVIAKLKDDYRVLVELSYLKGYTQEEISNMLNIPMGTIKTRLRKALIDLRQLM